MARYGKETTLPPRRVLRLARAAFGPDAPPGLTVAAESLSAIRFAGPDGGVEVTALPRPGDPALTDVTILSREYDPWAERFLATLTDAERGPGLARRLWDAIKGRRSKV
jgi:hypothetical protein